MPTEPKDYTQDEDVRLMLAVKAGDAAAFEQLVSRHQERILSTLVHFSDSLQQAEELTQEVFLKVYEARLRYEPTAKFTTWLYRIVRNEGLNAKRYKKRHPERYLNASSPSDGEDANFEENLLAKSGFMPARQYDAKEEREMVHLALKSLDPRQREAILYQHVEGMDYSQIAQVMELTVPAVKSLLYRARRRLAEILTPYMSEGRLPQ